MKAGDKAMTSNLRFLTIISAVLLACPAQAAEMVHIYTNPDFGGSPLNGAYLLSNAAAQNTFTAPTSKTTSASSSSSTTTTSGQQFATELNQLVLNALANNLVNQALGTNSSSTPTTPGIKTFNTGVSQITVDTTSGTSTAVTIVDNASGTKTVVDIPNF